MPKTTEEGFGPVRFVRKRFVVRNLVELLELLANPCYAGLQPEVMKHIRTAARRKVLVLLRRTCYAGLQLEVVKRIATAGRRVVLGYGATRELCGTSGSS